MNLFRNKRIVISLLAVILVAAGAFVAARLLWKEDPREFYFRAESDNFSRFSKWLNANYTAFLEKEKPYKTVPYKRHLEVTADVTSGGKPFGMENADRLYDLIKRSKLVIDTQRQPRDDIGVSNLTLLVERVPFIDTTAWTKGGKLYFTIPVLMPDRCFQADLGKLDEVYDKFSVPVRPRRLVNAADIAQTVQFDESSFDKSAAKLGSIFKERIGKSAVTYGSTREMTISGQTIKGTEVLVSLDEAAATDLVGGLFRTAASDDALLAYTYGNAADISTMLDEAGLFRLSEFLDQTGTVVLNANEKKLAGMLNFRKNLDTFRNSLKSAFDGYSIKTGLKMAVFIDRKGNLLDRRLSFDLVSGDGSRRVSAEIHTGNSNTRFDDVRSRFISLKLDSVDATTEISFIPDFRSTNGTDEKGKIDFRYRVVHKKDMFPSEVHVSLNLSGETDAKTLKRTDILGFQVDIGYDEGKGSISGDWSMVSRKNKKLNSTSHTTRLNVKADLPTFGIRDLSAVIDLSGEDRLDIGTIELPDALPDKTMDLNAATTEQLDKLKLEAAASFGTFYLTNKPVFDAILGQ